MVDTAQTLDAPRLGDLRTHREEILRIVTAHGASNVRVFGSVARGDAVADSDVDLLVDLEAPPHGFAYFGAIDDLRQDLADLLGREVDVVDSAALRSMRERVLRDAVPL
jgi:predicted nucleotidyltransferase